MSNNIVNVFDDFFNNNNRFVGFNDFFNMDLSKGLENKGFPPYNIYTRLIDQSSSEEIDPIFIKHTIFEIACAGYGKENLKVSFNKKTHELRVVGEMPIRDVSKNEDFRWVHKGIAERNFTLSWQLQPNLVFEKMSFEDGILTIDFSETKMDDVEFLTIK